jgi:Glycogen debranching enzyme
MTISFDRNFCCDLNETIAREWLVTNGLGGYAAGTVAGVLTRIQHGLLVATPPNAVTPQLLLAKIDEEVTFDRRTYYLGTNEYRDGIFNPSGFVHLETFRLEAGFPVFTYRLGGIDGIVLEKRIWMARGHNTTYIQYRVLPQQARGKPDNKRNESEKATPSRSQGLLKPVQQETAHSLVELTLLPFTAYRAIHSVQRGDNNSHFHVQVHDTEARNEAEKTFWTTCLPAGVAGCTIQAHAQAYPYHVLAVGLPRSQATFIPTGVWYWNFRRRCEVRTNQRTDDLYLPGVIRATLWADESATLTIVVSTEELDTYLYNREQIALLYKEDQQYKEKLAERAVYLTGQRQRAERSAELITPADMPVPFIISSPKPYMQDSDHLRYLLYNCEHFLTEAASTAKSKVSQSSAMVPEQQRQRSTGTRSKSQEATLLTCTEYFSLENRTRDTLIALPGILLAGEHATKVRHYLRTLANYFIDGLLPERKPTLGQAPTDTDYRSIDLPLWYYHALDQYINATQDYSLLEELFPTLTEWMHNYIQGTYKGISVDAYDSLLYAEKEGQAYTWMDAYKEGKPVTPRAGKPVEINALWYQALQLMAEWSEKVKTHAYAEEHRYPYREIAENCRTHFQQRFWHQKSGHLYDVVDGPEGDDLTLRVNQIFAIAFRYPVLAEEYQQSILDVVTHRLLTPYGLRTLAPEEPAYHGHLLIDQHELRPEIEPAALHQGAIWTWLIGPYTDALIAQQTKRQSNETNRVTQEHLQQQRQRILTSLKERFHSTLLGTCEGIFPGDIQYQAAVSDQPGYQLASLSATAELLRAYVRLSALCAQQPADTLTH